MNFDTVQSACTPRKLLRNTYNVTNRGSVNYTTENDFRTKNSHLFLNISLISGENY